VEAVDAALADFVVGLPRIHPPIINAQKLAYSFATQQRVD